MAEKKQSLLIYPEEGDNKLLRGIEVFLEMSPPLIAKTGEEVLPSRVKEIYSAAFLGCFHKEFPCEKHAIDYFNLRISKLEEEGFQV